MNGSGSGLVYRGTDRRTISPSQISTNMKTIRFPLFVLAAGLVASSLFATRSFAAAAQANLGHPNETLIALETQKTVYLFGTPEQKQLAVQMFDPEFEGIGYGPAGPGRENYATVVALAGFFPMLPPDASTLSDWHVVPVGPNTYVVSYISIGPGPHGDVVSFYQSSTWTWRAGSWKTLFFHQTLMATP
jgi:hypothetical protein